MQISCPKCASNYNLDERLLPPGGAPVQCTHCGLVFTASPSGASNSPTDPDLSQPPPAETGPRATQMFGITDAPKPKGPQVGGAAAAPPSFEPDPARRTQMFGAVSGTPAAPDPGRSTQMFGSGTPSMPPPAGADRSTQMFGAMPGASPPADPGRSTQMFGSGTPSMPPPAGADRSTQMFGAMPGAPPPADPGRSTQMFGSGTPSVPPPADPGRSTQMFGGGVGPPPGPMQPIPSRTQIFGKATASGETPSPAPNRTQIFGKVPSLAAPADLSLTQELSILDRGVGPADRGGLSATQTQSRSSVELPPEPPRFGRGRTSTDETVKKIQRSQTQSRLWRWVVLLLIVVGISAVFVHWYLKRAKALPLDVLTAKEASYDLIRRDDPRSLARAAEQLQRLATDHPEASELRADQVLALSLELDELKLRIHHLKTVADAQNAAISRLQEHQTPSDWRSQVEERRQELKTIKAKSDPLIAQAEAKDTEVNNAFKALSATAPEEAQATLPVLRAQAVYFGVKGSDQTLTLIERYRRQGAQDGWDSLAYAEYALNAHVAPDTQKEALVGVKALKASDSGMLRAYLLSARLKKLLKDAAGSAEDLEAASALNPHHDTAREMLIWQRTSE